MPGGPGGGPCPGTGPPGIACLMEEALGLPSLYLDWALILTSDIILLPYIV